MLSRLQGILCAIALGALLFFYGEQIWRSSECAHAPKDDACHKHAAHIPITPQEHSALLDFVAHDGITFFTFMLAILTGGLVIVSAIQIRFLIRADETAQKSAEAALKAAKATEESVSVARETAKQQFETTKESVKLASDEFIASHRPRIILREAITGSFLQGEKIKVLFQLANVGETTGRIIRSSLRVELVGRVERPFLHDSVETKYELGEIILSPGTSILLHYEGDAPVWENEKFKLRSMDTTAGVKLYREATIHFCGQFIYTDQTGIWRRTAFRRELRPERQRFYRIPDEPDLDYSD